MDIMKVIGLALLTTFTIIILKPTRPDIALLVGVAGGVIMLFMFVDALEVVILNMNNIVNRTGIDSKVFSAILKIIGIGYLTEFAAGVCNDAGNSAMGQKVLLAGKVIILILALPIINSLIDVVAGLVQ